VEGNVRALIIANFTWVNSGKPRNAISLADLWTEVRYWYLLHKKQLYQPPDRYVGSPAGCMSGCCNAVRYIACKRQLQRERERVCVCVFVCVCVRVCVRAVVDVS
jgi:hypothetical protein